MPAHPMPALSQLMSEPQTQPLDKLTIWFIIKTSKYIDTSI